MSSPPNQFRDGSLCPLCRKRPKTNAQGCGACLRKVTCRVERKTEPFQPAIRVVRHRGGLSGAQAEKLAALRDDEALQ